MKQLVVFSALVLFLSVSITGAAEKTECKGYSYVGAKKCKMCHNSAKAGKQYTIWSEGSHAGAYNALASDKAKAVAKGMGIEDPQKSDKCLKCHAPSHAVKAEMKGKKWDLTEGVSCEDCHGAGSAYQKMSVMKAIAAGKEKPEAHGLTIPDEKTCLNCHNEESPTFDKAKPFNFKERYAKIAHEKPAAAKK